MIEILELKKRHIRKVVAFWKSISELGYSSKFDDEKRIARFIKRNRKISSIALEKDDIIGALLCGHDGRRGFMYHTGVSREYRKTGVGRKLVERSLNMLKSEGLDTCFLFTDDSNKGAHAFWKKMGFAYAPHVMYHSRSI